MKDVVAALLLAAAPFLASAAESFNANPSADAFTTPGPSGNLSGNNYGGSGALSLAAPGLPQGEFQSVLQFNLAGAVSSFNTLFGPGLWSVQSVTLRLTGAAAANPIFNTPAGGRFGVSWMRNDSWVEGTGMPNAPGASGITFSSLQNTFIGAGDENLGTFDFNGAASGQFNYSLGLTPDFTSDLLAGDNLSLRLLAADSTVSGVFNSRSFATAANRPVLTIAAVPEPATVVLGAVGPLLWVGAWLARARNA